MLCTRAQSGIQIMMAAAEKVCLGPCVSMSFSASGFEGYSLVPSIYPLETLHNSLSLKQVDEFLTALCKNGSETQFKRLKSKWMKT